MEQGADGLANRQVADEVIERTLMVIRTRYDEPLSLDYLADVAGLSKFYFCRRFQRVIGVTPVQFLISVRMQEAQLLLRSTALSVAEITRRVGYRSVGTFTTRFTALHGMAPDRYRRWTAASTESSSRRTQERAARNE